MRVELGGVEFDNLTMAETVDAVVAHVRGGAAPGYICTGNLDHLAMLSRDAEFREIYHHATLVLADGMPIVWLSRMCRGGPLKERVAGSDLFWELGRASAEHGLRLFLMGGVEGAAEQAAAALARRYPGVQVVGCYCPPHTTFGSAEEQERIRTAIRAAQPDVLLVGLGAPKQEKWIAANLKALAVPLSVGVGGSFEMAAGIIPRAPRWQQRVGLEWLHRLAREPRRMWRRYICRDLPYLARLAFTTALNRGRR